MLVLSRNYHLNLSHMFSCQVKFVKVLSIKTQVLLGRYLDSNERDSVLFNHVVFENSRLLLVCFFSVKPGM